MTFLGSLKYYVGSTWCKSAYDVIKELEIDSGPVSKRTPVFLYDNEPNLNPCDNAEESNTNTKKGNNGSSI